MVGICPACAVNKNLKFETPGMRQTLGIRNRFRRHGSIGRIAIEKRRKKFGRGINWEGRTKNNRKKAFRNFMSFMQENISS